MNDTMNESGMLINKLIRLSAAVPAVSVSPTLRAPKPTMVAACVNPSLFKTSTGKTTLMVMRKASVKYSDRVKRINFRRKKSGFIKLELSAKIQ
ncbi:hypothetical protein GCM10023313_15240 [Mucilaginibacter defluvii]|uniref:Uncharacterized protein n=1 Tax=Mucilaginibacter defluvii TaxID=1196019 RepID=A0ABP9FQD7_9SPHI